MISVDVSRDPNGGRRSARRIGRGLLRLLEAHEVACFLLVGGVGYVVDVATFNLLAFTGPLASLHPVVARTIAVLAAMCVTYVGNHSITWRAYTGERRRREILLFVLFNAIGFLISAGMLVLSHDVLGLTSRLADNVSSNVLGVGLGTAFRFVTYRRFVFVGRRR